MDIELTMVTISAISAISAAIAAIISLVATIQNQKSIKLQEIERHAMVKPQFIVTNITEDRIARKYEFNIVNIGYKILNDIVAKWEGNEKADVKLDKYIDVEGILTYGIKLNLKLRDDSYDRVTGRIILYYTDVLGKNNEESIDLTFKEVQIDGMDELLLLIETELYGSQFN
ncbi:MAG: hypothetical protein PHY33_06365 [Methanobacteriaceae archaeon]|nr:hypothetical protein [Methanobacteriaceae archaeon]